MSSECILVKLSATSAQVDLRTAELLVRGLALNLAALEERGIWPVSWGEGSAAEA